MTLGSLTFLSPWVLSALISLPLIWWLIRAIPPSPQRVDFPAFIILRRLQETEETPDKTPWWLILLRLVFAALVIIGLAQPILNAPERDELGTTRLIIVDNSYAAAPGWGLRKAALEQEAERIRNTPFETYVITTAPATALGPEKITGPLNAAELRRVAQSLNPVPFAPDRAGIVETLTNFRNQISGPVSVLWLSDSLTSSANSAENTSIGDTEFLSALTDIGSVTQIREPEQNTIAIHQFFPRGDDTTTITPGVSFRIHRPTDRSNWQGTLIAQAGDGRILDRQAVQLLSGETETIAQTNLPLALQNDMRLVRIEEERSAGAIWLMDARNRRALIGLPTSQRIAAPSNLLDGYHYIREALRPYAQFQSDSIQELIASNVSLIVLDDVGTLRDDEISILTDWVNEGGVLLRFSGPAVAEAALDRNIPLSPVSLRRGERAFGGALTWDTPKPLAEFTSDGPFAGVPIPEDVFIRQQVLAQPGGATSEATWATLEDGTPLITGRAIGQGHVVLFHVTATPRWSDLPISETFIDILRKITFLSNQAPVTPDQAQSGSQNIRYAPVRLLDGFGTFITPTDEVGSITTTGSENTPSPITPPGLYGSFETPIAINTITANETLTAFNPAGITTRPYTPQAPQRLWAWCFGIALILFLLDMLATLFLSGRLLRPSLQQPRVPVSTLLAIIFILIGDMTGTSLTGPYIAHASESSQAPLDPPISQPLSESILQSRFAYVKTEDQSIDRISHTGLEALSRELSRRTTVSPGQPVAITPGVDDISVYPILYWPIVPEMQSISDLALSDIENYMRLGGLIIFDTRDGERAIGDLETPEGAALRSILSRLNIPPLTPLPTDHVLTRSYYLLRDLRGRTAYETVWVAQGSAINDGVTPLIIGGRDWAGAWARTPGGTPSLPIISGPNDSGPRARENAFRAGINMVMMAFTGNYKTDQVHTETLLRRLGGNQ